VKSAHLSLILRSRIPEALPACPIKVLGAIRATSRDNNNNPLYVASILKASLNKPKKIKA
jgi:hypothetical protein